MRVEWKIAVLAFAAWSLAACQQEERQPRSLDRLADICGVFAPSDPADQRCPRLPWELGLPVSQARAGDAIEFGAAPRAKAAALAAAAPIAGISQALRSGPAPTTKNRPSELRTDRLRSIDAQEPAASPSSLLSEGLVGLFVILLVSVLAGRAGDLISDMAWRAPFAKRRSSNQSKGDAAEKSLEREPDDSDGPLGARRDAPSSKTAASTA